MIRSLLIIVLAILVFSVDSAAQTRTPHPPSSDFNIELINVEGPSHLEAVPGAGARSGFITTRFRRISEWKPAPGSPGEVSAMKVDFRLEGDTVKVEVTAYLGQLVPNFRPPDLEKMQKVVVATRLIRENETVNINEVEQYGLEPIGFKVLRSKPWSVGTPEITNKTQALIVTAISEERPMYHVTTRNLSQKCITSIRWYGLENGSQFRGGSGLSGKCIICAGGPFELVQRFELAEQAGQNAQPPGKREIVINAILFDDGTFEGDVDAAASMAAHMAGEKIQSARTGKLLQATASASAGDVGEMLAQLKRDVKALDEEIDKTALDDLLTRFANASPDLRERRIGEEIRNGLRFVKITVLGRIEQFEYKRAHMPEQADFSAWLKEMTKMTDR